MTKIFLRLANKIPDQLGEILWDDVQSQIYSLGDIFKSSLSNRKPSLPTAGTLNVQLHSSERDFLH